VGDIVNGRWHSRTRRIRAVIPQCHGIGFAQGFDNRTMVMTVATGPPASGTTVVIIYVFLKPVLAVLDRVILLRRTVDVMISLQLVHRRKVRVWRGHRQFCRSMTLLTGGFGTDVFPWEEKPQKYSTVEVTNNLLSPPRLARRLRVRVWIFRSSRGRDVADTLKMSSDPRVLFP
jgi:hypothetical protein